MGSYLSTLRRRLGLIAVVTVLLAPLAFLALTTGGRSYESVAVVQVGSRLAAGVVGLETPYEDAETLLATETQFFESDAVAEGARADLAAAGWDESTDELLGRVVVTGRGVSNLMDVAGTDPDPQRARELTDAFVASYLALRQDGQRAAVQGVVDELEAQRADAEAELAALDGTDTSAAAQRERAAAQSWYDSVTDQIERARLRLSVDTSGVVLVSAAGPAESSAAIPTPLAAALSLAGALLLALATALVLDLLRDPVRTRAEAQDLLSAPVLGVLGEGGGSDPHGLGTSGGPTGAAARGARLRLEQLTGGTAPRAVAVTAPPTEAADAVRVGTALAAAWGRAGLRVVLVADAGAETLRSVVVSGPGDLGAGIGAFHTSLPGVWLVPAVSAPDLGTGLADHAAPDTVFSALRRAADVVVLVDTRPEVPETAAVAPQLDVVTVVGVLDATPSRRLTDLARSLEEYGITVDGVLLTRRRRRGSHRAGTATEPAGTSAGPAVEAASAEAPATTTRPVRSGPAGHSTTRPRSPRPSRK